MSEALQQLIRQAEIQKLQMEMNLRFKKNLDLFKVKFPKLYKLLNGKTPKDWVLRLDQHDNLNLYSQTLKQFLYNETPVNYCKKQVEDFKAYSKTRRFRVVRNKPYNDSHLHIPRLNDLIDAYEREDKVPRLKQTPDYITTLIVTGVGLGYHLIELIRSLDIVNIVIYEGNTDAFLASMQVIDWEPILDFFFEKGRTIGLCVGTNPKLAMAQIEYMVNNNGLFTMAYSFLFAHTRRDEEMDFVDTYERDLRSYIGGIGYFDDEQIGLAHAYHNLRSDAAVFINKKTHERKTPIFIVGNGPSLDMHEEYIKAHKEEAIVISCGTGLASLLRMGIKPDYHVEMERCLLVKEILDYSTEPDQRKGITLLCLHTVSPETIELFDDACYAIKPNDAGNPLIHHYFKPEKLNDLYYCNPTVSNCGLAFAVFMGFENIQLIGTDFGVKTSDDHHSKHSIYKDMEKQLKKTEPTHRFFKEKDALVREANFGGEVLVNPVLDMARVSMERFLLIVHQTFPNVRVINTNNGALISGTLPTPLNEVELPFVKANEKAKEIASLKGDHFHRATNESFEALDPTKLLSYFFCIEDDLKLRDHISADKDMIEEFKRIYKLIDKKQDAVASILLKGTVNFFLTLIAEHSCLCENEKDRSHRYKLGQEHYNRLIEDIYKKMRKSPFELDATHSPLVAKMKEAKESSDSP